jgi:hypothetical protein
MMKERGNCKQRPICIGKTNKLYVTHREDCCIDLDIRMLDRCVKSRSSRYHQQ